MPSLVLIKLTYDSGAFFPAWYKLSFKEKKVTYLKVKINEVNKIPAFHNGAAGKPGFLFIDEIEVN